MRRMILVGLLVAGSAQAQFFPGPIQMPPDPCGVGGSLCRPIIIPPPPPNPCPNGCSAPIPQQATPAPQQAQPAQQVYPVQHGSRPSNQICLNGILYQTATAPGGQITWVPMHWPTGQLRACE